jgi:hypothetical protein
MELTFLFNLKISNNFHVHRNIPRYSQLSVEVKILNIKGI